MTGYADEHKVRHSCAAEKEIKKTIQLIFINIKNGEKH